MNSFIPHTQEELQRLGITENKSYKIKYENKDYYNGESTLEIGQATAVLSDGNIYFNVLDPYGMDKLIMRARILS